MAKLISIAILLLVVAISFIILKIFVKIAMFLLGLVAIFFVAVVAYRIIKQ